MLDGAPLLPPSHVERDAMHGLKASGQLPLKAIEQCERELLQLGHVPPFHLWPSISNTH
jgi:hypothetical protein